MNKLIEVNKELNKYKAQKVSAEGHIIELMDDYRSELVRECVQGLMKILNEEGELTERDLKIYINNLSLDVRNLYLR